MAPSFDLYASIVNQLEYILKVLKGEEKNKDMLKNIIVGTYAVREFEQSDLELAELLIKVQAIALKMVKDIKA